MTLSHIGNTGANPEDVESDQPQVTALIVAEVEPRSSPTGVPMQPSTTIWNGTACPGSARSRRTRALTRRLRESGVAASRASARDGSHSADALP
jgi:carbamoyl-phosphate synthase small subunit